MQVNVILNFQKQKDEELYAEVKLCYDKLKDIAENLYEGRFKYFFEDKEALEKKASSGS